MDEKLFIRKCIMETAEGLREGLNRFSGPSRVAVIYAVKPGDPMVVYDPQNLLAGHEPKFKELFLDKDDWQKKCFLRYDKKKFSNLLPEKNLELAGLISCGGRSGTVSYQMWFTEHHPDMCTIGPTERWLEQAVWRLSHDIANEEELYTGISGGFLKEYATHAVRDFLVDEMNVLLGWDTRIRVYPILEAVLKISWTPEEGAWPKGKLLFVEKRSLSNLKFLAEFPETERPVLDNVKHIRKLLQSVENSDRKLVADEETIIGIIGDEVPGFSITADFNGQYGFLSLNADPVCSFSDGSFKSTNRRPKLVQVEEVLLDSAMDPEEASALFKVITGIVHDAATHRHGCTLVVDLNPAPIFISCHSLQHPLDLRQKQGLDLAKSLSRVDGALHIGTDLKLRGFACLLHGHYIPGEHRARGARFNSALRFTAENENIVVIVVSIDAHVSVMMNGRTLDTQWKLKPSVFCSTPVLLKEWATASDLTYY
ncbi:DNA integrity scanning protein DisA nucleotide-binding domain protein [Desulfospira joergensenii]|uniref:DNA integrity scanning protein DisA nucleotide-binding domain protein n=1 Tax=Desulfospira joergensenii TaxID=53329 RepID=UPI0003B68129|nr:DNA integrity scanning protein DisA nucleotide-binding domain protein [Desulfospira joergensenii]